MKRHLLILIGAALFIGCLSVGVGRTATAAPCEDAVDCQRDRILLHSDLAVQEFIAAVMAHEAAFQAEDAGLTASFYAEDAISMPPGFAASHGREAILADLEFYFDSYDIERTFELDDYAVNGESAVRRGEWTQTLTPVDGSAPIVETGRCVLGFEKVDGEWKVAWEIWNTYE